MLKVLVCVSGGGTNLQAILDQAKEKKLGDVEIVRVISNNAGAYALTRAAEAGVSGVCVSPKDYANREEFHKAFLAAIDEVSPDLIVLAGFLVVIPKEVITKYRNRIINVHPSLIPSYYGLKVHEAALELGVKVTGATVHFVDEGTDTGPIILQKAVYVKEGDTPKTLQLRVMEEAEWEILPGAIRMIANGEVKLG